MKSAWTIIGEGASSIFSSASNPLPPAELDLEATLGCGQAFRWKQDACADEGRVRWTGIISGRVVSLWQDDATLYCTMHGESFDAALLDRYLDLGLDLAAVRREISIDPHIVAAMASYPGLRVLQQDPWECLISFILSQLSNVGRISKSVEALSERFGTEIIPGYFAFPTPDALARGSVEAFRAMGLGYRAEYVYRAARKCAEGGTEWLNGLAQMEYRAARDHIVLPLNDKRVTEKLHGVGPKVADCVLLFSLGHYEAFPVDVHVRRAMERWYGQEQTFGKSYDSVADFGRSHFGRYAGYAQQYLFHRQRTGE
ncbi:MAG: 8-oxoguanine DNA glycosylase [Armatimonadota bacterium]|nr:8-oxoguanine DNA glycosylase [Armatimonadota bacterium]